MTVAELAPIRCGAQAPERGRRRVEAGFGRRRPPDAQAVAACGLPSVLFGVLELALATPLAAAGLALTRRFYVGDYLRAGGERPEPVPAEDTPTRCGEGGRRG